MTGFPRPSKKYCLYRRGLECTLPVGVDCVFQARVRVKLRRIAG